MYNNSIQKKSKVKKQICFRDRAALYISHAFAVLLICVSNKTFASTMANREKNKKKIGI